MAFMADDRYLWVDLPFVPCICGLGTLFSLGTTFPHMSALLVGHTIRSELEQFVTHASIAAKDVDLGRSRDQTLSNPPARILSIFAGEAPPAPWLGRRRPYLPYVDPRTSLYLPRHVWEQDVGHHRGKTRHSVWEMSTTNNADVVTPRVGKYVRLGNSGLKVSRIFLGCMSYGSTKWEEWVLGEREELKRVKFAYDNGINTFDTADMYSNGESERIVGKALKAHDIPRENVVIMTKVFCPVREDGRPGIMAGEMILAMSIAMGSPAKQALQIDVPEDDRYSSTSRSG